MTQPRQLVWCSPWDAFERDYIRHGRDGDLQFLLSMHPLWGEASEKWRAVLDFGEQSSVFQDVESRAKGLLHVPALARAEEGAFSRSQL